MDSRPFELQADFTPAGDQPQAIDKLVEGLSEGLAHQTLLGVTGSGKTFSAGSVIQRVQRPTMVLAHNKTLAAQLYGEFREFFPHNAVEYFVSYYDYYQPEAYVPSSDTYIEKDSSVNEHIEQMRLVGHQGTARALGLDHRRHGLLDLRTRRPAGLSGNGAAPEARRSPRSAAAAAATRGHAVHAQRAGSHSGHLPGTRRCDRYLPGGVRTRGGAGGAVR